MMVTTMIRLTSSEYKKIVMTFGAYKCVLARMDDIDLATHQVEYVEINTNKDKYIDIYEL